MTPKFRFVSAGALEILDSRGRPTLEVTVVLDDGTTASAGVPSGASTGSGEAFERRDGGTRYRGAGVLAACRTVATDVASMLCGRAWVSLAEVDDALVALDGTPDKSRLGGNVTSGVSMAAARAMASSLGVPLWRYLSIPDVAPRLPTPHFNVVNGGAHAQSDLAFQEFLIAPLGATSVAEALRVGAEVYQALRATLHDAGHETGLGDEGGFSPRLSEPEQALDLLVTAIAAAGYRPALDDVAIALDPAASGFRGPDGRYRAGHEPLSSEELIDRYESLASTYPIWSLEDGLAEDDDEGWIALTRRLGSRLQLVGDDNFVTSPERIEAAAKRSIGNAALIKVNQVGTVTETLAAVDTARRYHYAQMVSHRSGETTDDFVADLAVAIGCGQVKFGAPARGERVAKYNRLLRIERDHPELGFGVLRSGPDAS